MLIFQREIKLFALPEAGLMQASVRI